MEHQVLEGEQVNYETLEEKVAELKVNKNDANKELEHLWRRVKTAGTLLTCLKSKAKFMTVPHLLYTSCGIKHQEGIGFVDKHGIPLSGWSKSIDLSSHEHSSNEILKSVHIVSDVMESLVKRVIMAEAEAATQKQIVNLGLEEIVRKTIQIESMSKKVLEMEKFALDTNGVLNEMRQKVEEMVEETSRQRNQAAENEEELHRVKRDFESLRSFVSSLISDRVNIVSSEKNLQTMEKLFDRLMEKNVHLESEKARKEADIQKLVEENVALRAMVDDKEAQLLAMNEQCKFMALNDSGI